MDLSTLFTTGNFRLSLSCQIRDTDYMFKKNTSVLSSILFNKQKKWEFSTLLLKTKTVYAENISKLYYNY